MRLLSTKTFEVTPINEDEIPPYAILSHTWDKDEVTLQDMQGLGVKSLSTTSRNNILKAKPGLRKVLEAARLAAYEGHDWIWIDTCCIDKTSSAELSEAINSMYRWYQNSEICYVYLADATEEVRRHPKRSFDKAIRKSRWITRGWTLQELIAPRKLSFYSKDWFFIGRISDDHIMGPLTKATGIDIGVLSGDIATHEVLITNRMRWASKRQTRRQEDMAYCLMGVFGVNMPLLYGEGGVRAFLRLQNEILRTTDDQTIFAWSMPPGEKEARGASGLLAESPGYFQHAPNMYYMPGWSQSESSIPWSMTNQGLMVQLYLRPTKSDLSAEDDTTDEFLAVLDCSAEIKKMEEDDRECIHEYSPAISLRRLWGDQYARVHKGALEYVKMRDRRGGEVRTLFVKQDQSFSLPSFTIPEKFLRGTGSFIVSDVYPRNLWNLKSGIFRSGLPRERCIQGLFRFSYPPGSGISDGLFDVAVALQSTELGQFESVGILRPPEGRTARQAYDHINKAWVSASQGGKAELADKYRDQMIALLQLRRIQRFSGVSYLVDLVHRVELDSTVSHQIVNDAALTSPGGLSTVDGCMSDEEQLRLLLRPICVSEASRPCRLMLLANRIRIRSRNKHCLERNSAIPLAGLSTSELPSTANISLGAEGLDRPSEANSCCEFIRHEIQCDRPNADDLNAMYNNITAAIGEGDRIAAVRAKSSDHTDKPVQLAISQDRLVHYVAFHGDPQVISWLKGQCFQLERDTAVSTGLHIESILCNAMNFREFLSGSKSETDFTPNVMSSCRKLLGAVRGTQDTALHYAATYSTKEEFDRIMMGLFRAAEGPEPWYDFDVKHEWAYLFRLQNGNGETVLHRAVAMSNLDVVTYICEHAPDVAGHLDSMNRSTLWHAACGGDDRIVSVLATTLESLSWAPKIDHPDDNGLTPLHVACREGNLYCAKALLDLGASPSCVTQSAGLTPIHYASLFGHVDCLLAMAEARADFDQIVSNEDNGALLHPIHLAAANGWLQCVKALINHGSPLAPMASVMCTARVSPSGPMPTPISHTCSDTPEETEVQVQRIPKSMPEEVAARTGWDEVAEYLRDMRERVALRGFRLSRFFDRDISISSSERSVGDVSVDS